MARTAAPQQATYTRDPRFTSNTAAYLSRAVIGEVSLASAGKHAQGVPRRPQHRHVEFIHHATAADRARIRPTPGGNTLR